MKTHDGKKRSFKWLIFLCAFLVLAGAVTAGLLLFPFGQKDAPVDNRLYWNIDGVEFRSQDNPRFANDDSYIYITFACEGEQMRLPVVDMQTA